MNQKVIKITAIILALVMVLSVIVVALEVLASNRAAAELAWCQLDYLGSLQYLPSLS